VGDTGPGGGIVYYVDNAGFSCGASYTPTGSPTGGLCKYLEVAPSGWSGGGTDPLTVWAATANQRTDVTDITNESSAYNNALGIGLGYKNSDLIVVQNGIYNAATNNYAAGAARAYAGGSKNDWYLPTTAELNLLCQWNRGVTQDVTTGCSGGSLNGGSGGASGSGFAASYYWSSSERSSDNAWQTNFIGFQDSYEKSVIAHPDHVRPIRAF
jgi:hypothetical protein